MAQHASGIEEAHGVDVSNRVVAAVADARDVDPLELPVLFEVIDPDALDRLFQHGHSFGRSGPDRVVFTLADCEVIVHGDGTIDVTAPDERPISASAAGHTDQQSESDPSTE